MADDAEIFLEWVNAALDFGIDRLNEHEVHPFVLIELSSGGRHVSRIKTIGDDSEDAAERDVDGGREYIAGVEPERFYALIWDGCSVGDQGEEQHGVFVEAADRLGHAGIFASRYQPTESGELARVGGVLFVSKAPALWPPSTSKPRKSRRQPPPVPAPPEPEPPIETLEQLAHHALHVGLDLLGAGHDLPFVILIEGNGKENRMVLQNSRGNDVEELVSWGRELISEQQGAVLYALVYFGNMERDGKPLTIIAAEAEDRAGQALLYVQSYELNKSGKVVRRGQPNPISKIQGLWNGGARIR